MPIDPWETDLLSRKRDADHLVEVLLRRYHQRAQEGRTASYILNIDARWGEGKSFFVEALRTQLSQQGHLTALINAWRDDMSDEPLSTIIEAIDDSIRPIAENSRTVAEKITEAKRKLGIIAIESGKQVSKHLAKMALGISVDAIADKVGVEDGRGDDLADELTAMKAEAAGIIESRIKRLRLSRDAIAGFKQDVSSALHTAWQDNEKIIEPMFVFVDELDRCRPTYAIELLEEVKHLFDINGIVFVIATDSEQLAHSVKAVYGAEFEGRRYLRRFFDRTFVFPQAPREKLVTQFASRAGIEFDQFFKFGEEKPVRQISGFLDAVSASNRDLEQLMDMLEVFVTSWPHQVRISLVVLLPILWAVYRSDWQEYEALSRAHVAPNSPLARWRLAYRGYRSGTNTMEERLTTGDTAYTQFRSAAQQDLPTILQTTIEDLYKGIYANEFQVMHDDRYIRDDPPFSVVKEYAERAKNAGRVLGDEIPI